MRSSTNRRAWWCIRRPAIQSGTLVNALLFHVKNLSGINGVLRPGIVHRLDKDTTGLIVIAKNDVAHQEPVRTDQRKNRIQDILGACALGNVKEDDVLREHAPVARHKTDRKKMAVDPKGREAVTHFRVLRRYGRLYPAGGETGDRKNAPDTRAFKILSATRYAVIPCMGRKKQSFRLQKGSCSTPKNLGFIHPKTNEQKCCLKQTCPGILQKLSLDFLEKTCPIIV